MEGEDRCLDGEGDEEAEEDPVVRGDARVDERERVLGEPEDDDRRQHQQRPGHRVDHERRRRAQAARPAPDADQDVDRDQHRLEEDVEDEQVLGGEDADDRARQEEQQAVVGAAAVASRPERVGDRDRADDDGQAGEEEREAVEADVVGDTEIAEPAVLVAQLQALREVELLERDREEHDLGERREQRQRPGRTARERQQPDDERGGEREDDQRSRHWTLTKTTTRIGDREGDREGIAAQVAGLGTADGTGRLSRPDGDTRDRAADQRLLDPAPEDAGEQDGRLVEDQVVELVEPELVLERRSAGRDTSAPAHGGRRSTARRRRSRSRRTRRRARS